MFADLGSGGGGGGGDLSNYYTKDIIDGEFYRKSQVYTKAEIDTNYYTKTYCNSHFQEQGSYATSFQLQGYKDQLDALSATVATMGGATIEGSVLTTTDVKALRFTFAMLALQSQWATSLFRVGAQGGQGVNNSVITSGWQLHFFNVDHTTGTQEYFDGFPV